MTSVPAPFGGPSAWDGRSLREDDRLVTVAPEWAEKLRAAADWSAPVLSAPSGGPPVSAPADLVPQVTRRLREGPGAVVVRGLPIEAECVALRRSFCAFLGTPRPVDSSIHALVTAAPLSADNSVVLHGITEFTDASRDPRHQRCLVRVWLD
ncbi:hypothetical protein ACIQ6Y_32350 [Streptomyces sp. NPDC096205]|uniref:hypothetical protein n=1 Tax=Streptomyces sp. NPDC096205 TaxID=3366081 RepID=UPI00382A986A